MVCRSMVRSAQNLTRISHRRLLKEPLGVWRVLGALVVMAFSISISISGHARAEEAEMEFEPEAITKSGPPSEALKRGITLYNKKKDYYQASIVLHDVVTGKSGDGEANRQQAEFWLGKTLYYLGFYSASLTYFDRIVQKGTGHRFFSSTLKWLASLSQMLPESAGILAKIGKYDKAQLNQPALKTVRSELFYLLGRHNYKKQNFKEAISLFASVPPQSAFYARAKFMEGVTYVRLYQAKPAAAAFKTVLRTAREAPDTNEISQFEELAKMALARVFYSTKQYDLSVKYFEQVPRTSDQWLASLFESAWAYFMRNDFSKALGNIHTLNAPFFDRYSFPESLVLKSVIYWKNCLYDRSDMALTEFYGKYPALKRELESIVKQTDDPVEFFDYVVKVEKKTVGLRPSVRRLVLSAISDKETKKAFDYVTELDRQLARVQRARPAWKATPIAGEVVQDLTLQRSLAQNTAGDIARRRLQRLVREIGELNKQAIRVEYENINGRKNRLESTLRQEQVVATRAGGQQRDISPDDEHLYWPFDGEYWRDELGYYRFKIVSKCTR